MNESGFIKLAKMLLEELHDVRVGEAALCLLLTNGKPITNDSLNSARSVIAAGSTSQARLKQIQRLEELDLDTFLKNFRGTVQ